MRVALAAFLLLALWTSHDGRAVAADWPDWAYPWAPDFKVAPADDTPRHMPDSGATFTTRQARDLFFSPDWHPADHPPMPEIVAAGRRPDVRACGSCHRAEGTGGPENASLAGLPADYIVQQMADFKSGARQFSGPQRSAVTLMITIAQAASEEEARTAANYFAALKPKTNIKVVEGDATPKTDIARLFYVLSPEGGTEPLGQRIIEVPADVEQFELRDSRAQFLAYVPNGSVAKGKALATAVRSYASPACGTCHGHDLKGLGAVPGIAGRSPSYLARQLYDMQQGTRAGDASALMRPVVANLSHDDIIALAAYLASLAP